VPAVGSPAHLADPGTPTRPTAAQELAARHVDLVGHVVRQVAGRYPRHVDREELWSAGAHGLVEAARSYNAESGVPFVRYAQIRVRGAIIDSTRSRDWAARSVRRAVRELDTVEDRFVAEHGRRPGDGELATLIGIGVDELHARRSAVASATVLQLDAPVDVGGDGEGTLGERVAEQAVDRLPDASLERAELLANLTRAISMLPPTQREVVERSFIDGELLSDIADSMGVTEARVSQIRAEALAAMRVWFGSLYDGVPEVPADTPGKRSRAAYLATMGAQSAFRARIQQVGSPVAAAPRRVG
jgi:RNA polymerase sigma factor for flagellar operon FliA